MTSLCSPEASDSDSNFFPTVSKYPSGQVSTYSPTFPVGLLRMWFQCVVPGVFGVAEPLTQHAHFFKWLFDTDPVEYQKAGFLGASLFPDAAVCNFCPPVPPLPALLKTAVAGSTELAFQSSVSS